ncbi:RnfABCDGE type electron transport complex subunit D [Klebsiella variicola subsp. variicola]|nr:RnfABCDGE type electron transport complex subunit D [Klebsiella variicola subsp. variicola]
MLGTAFAVVIAKQLYGGLGHNPFNPAMIGYVVLLISFPVQMTSWLPSYEIAAQVPAFSDVLQMIFTGIPPPGRHGQPATGYRRHQPGHPAGYL